MAAPAPAVPPLAAPAAPNWPAHLLPAHNPITDAVGYQAPQPLQTPFTLARTAVHVYGSTPFFNTRESSIQRLALYCIILHESGIFYLRTIHNRIISADVAANDAAGLAIAICWYKHPTTGLPDAIVARTLVYNELRRIKANMFKRYGIQIRLIIAASGGPTVWQNATPQQRLSVLTWIVNLDVVGVLNHAMDAPIIRDHVRNEALFDQAFLATQEGPVIRDWMVWSHPRSLLLYYNHYILQMPHGIPDATYPAPAPVGQTASPALKSAATIAWNGLLDDFVNQHANPVLARASIDFDNVPV